MGLCGFCSIVFAYVGLQTGDGLQNGLFLKNFAGLQTGVFLQIGLNF